MDVAVAVVLDDRNVVPPGDVDEQSTTVYGHVDARRVLVGGERVDELRLARLAEFVELGFEKIDAHAIRIHGQADHIDTKRTVGGDGSGVRELLADHRIARLGQGFGDQGDGLHGSVHQG